MKWYQTLFCKVFIATWLMSALLIGGLVYGLLRANETHHWQTLMETRATGYAQLLIERRDRESVQPRRIEPDRNRVRFPIRITDLSTGEVIHDFRRGETLADIQSIDWLADNGQAYRLEIPKPEQPMHLERMLRFLLSVQMALILVVSMLVSLLVSVWVVKPINRLKEFTRRLHDEQNFSHRADATLSTRQDEIGALAREFNQMAGVIEKTLQAREELLRNVSHELRAPLARLQVATAILEQQSTQADHPLLNQINQESEHLTQLIDQLLSLSRLDDLALNASESFDFEVFFAELRQKYLVQYPNHTVAIQVTPKPLHIKVNADLLERILGNLLENALKYSPEGSSVKLEATQTEQQLVIICADQGSGVDEHKLEKIFEPFYRDNHLPNGYGLGLSIVKSGVEKLKGRVMARNLAQGGFEVEIRLPNR